MRRAVEKRLLQAVVGVACLVPVLAGAAGMWTGVRMLGGGNVNLDSHFRYLSGLLLGLGLAFASAIPHIERHTDRFRVLTLMVVVGGLARLLAVFFVGTPALALLAALIMELVVTPVLCLWQNSLARRYGGLNNGDFA